MQKIIANYKPSNITDIFDQYNYDEIVDENIIDKMTEEDYANVEELYLDFKNVPHYFNLFKLYLCKSLKKLIIKNALLTSVPLAIKNLTNLEALCINDNFITEIPLWLCEMTNLKEISFNNNLISLIPNEISNLTKLKRLSFSCNRITTIPKCLNELKELEQFLIYKNNIEYIPLYFNENLKNRIISQLN